MNLENYFNKLVQKGFLKRERIGLDQVRALMRSAEKNLSAARKTLAIDEETCYAMAYTGMLKIARAIIFLHGLRPDDGQQHKTTVEVSGMILGDKFNSLIKIFDKMRKKRNKFTYDPMTPVSKEEARSALVTSEEFLSKVRKHLERTDPQKKLF
ncbi:MAG: HEPN domain-containing protein [Parcubacteria group bacterium]|jgi:uncharacterized protein (UPF0332 family)